MSVSSSVLGLVTPQSITPAPQPNKPDLRFGEEDREAEAPAAIFKRRASRYNRLLLFKLAFLIG